MVYAHEDPFRTARLGALALAPLLEELRLAHKGNLRDVFLALYDLGARGDPRLALPLGPSRAHPPRTARAD